MTQDNHQNGAAFIVWGGIDVEGGSANEADVIIRGDTTGRLLGYGARNVGDLNGDEINDLAVSEGRIAPSDVLLFYGPFDEQGTFYDDDNDVRFVGDGVTDDQYVNMLGPGDMTGDGVPDLIIGSQYNETYADELAGLVYLVPGRGW